MTRITGPLFKWFGSKWLSSKTLPKPEHDAIVEPFAGGGGYSLRHYEKHVILYEKDNHISSLWAWLINRASEQDIREIPINLNIGQDIRQLDLSNGQALLLKTWQRTNNVGNCWTVSPWGNSPGQWTANTRARVAEESQAIKHWVFAGTDAFGAFTRSHESQDSGESTWFVDPPYQYNYQYRQSAIDYKLLSQHVHSLSGQVIVCEAVCQKTGTIPTWLPFKAFGSRITSRRKKENNHHSKELIYTGAL